MASESRKAINRRHYLKNRERYKAVKLAYYHETYKGRVDPAERAAYHKRWRQENPEKARGTVDQRKARYQREAIRYKIDPAYHAKICMKNRKKTPRSIANAFKRNMRLYGLTPELFAEMVAKQNGCCAICLNSSGIGKAKRRFLHVDHCHATTAVRGLLCQKCNHALGLFKDNTDTMQRAIEYLQRSRKT